MQDNELHLADYWAVLRQRRWVIFLAVTVCASVAVLAAFLSTPLYRATATLQIERHNPDILTFRDLSQVDYSWPAYSDFYETQYRILSSEAVARRAVDRLDLTAHPTIRDAPRPGLLTRLRGLVPRRSTGRTVEPLEAATSMVQAGLEIAPIQNSHLVEVSWVSPDADLSAQVANAVADAYIQYNIAAQYSTSDQATEFLVDQIETLKLEIATIERSLQEYGESKRIVSADDASNITMQALSDIARRRTEAQTELAQLEAIHVALRDTPDAGIQEVLNSRVVGDLKTEYAQIEAELSEMSRVFKDDWPAVQSLRSRLEQVEERLRLETHDIASRVRAAALADYLEAREEVRNLDTLLHDQEGAAQQLRRDAVEFNNLRTEVEKKRDTLDALIARQNEMALSTRLSDLDVTSSNIRVVTRARTPLAPFRPRTALNLAVGIVLGLGIGVVLAFLLDHVDNSLSSPAEVEAAVGLPTLAVIPHHGPTEGGMRLARRRSRVDPAATTGIERITHVEGRAVTSEAYRELRTAILLSGAGSPPRSLMVSSALPSEGKSATSVNLAIVLSQLGRRVLLVDTDLRRPRVHGVFDVGNGRGASTYLSGLADDLSDLVHPTGIPGLDLLTSGPIPPNPSELLNSDRFTQLVSSCLDGGYDHVVFDAPPTLSVADPVIISAVTDGLLLVVRAGATPRQSVRQAVDKFRQAGRTPTGVVLNDLSRDAHVYGPYRYHYAQYGDAQPDDESGPGAETA